MRVGNTTRILAVLKDRKKETVKTFFSRIPTRVRKTVRAVCSDMYDGFINAAKEVFGDKVKIIIDRFHVAKLYRKGVDTLRKAEMKRLKNTLVKEEYAKLKNVRWILRKDTKNLLDEELDVLQLLIRRDLSGSGLLTIVCKRFLIRELEDRFESQSRASRSGIALGVSPSGVSPQVVDHRLESATIPRPIAIAKGAKQLREGVGGGH